ncbi:MAG: hypothetical protein IKA65_07575 [Lentisphaeria bacterium]|nr:hypothetical protein [Lentisphaeria bacterium]
MDKKFFILKNNIVFGPFSRPALLDMYKQGKFSLEDAVSEDKIAWKSPAEVLDLIIPDADRQAVAPAPAEDKLNKQSIPRKSPKPLPVKNRADQANAPVFSGYPGFGELLAMTIGSLFGGSSMLKRFFCCGANSMLLGGGLMTITALLLTVLGIVFFGGCYNISYIDLGIRCSLLVLLSGATYWCINALIRGIFAREKYLCGNEADFLAAMYGMMNMAALTLVFNGTFFVFNRSIFSFTLLQITLVLAVALLPTLLFIANIILALSINFISSVKIRPDRAALLAVVSVWLSITAAAALLYTVYNK